MIDLPLVSSTYRVVFSYPVYAADDKTVGIPIASGKLWVE